MTEKTERRKEVSQFLERKCLVEKFGFIDNQNINLKMLNQRGLHLNEYGTRRLVNNFCYDLIKWWDAICLDRKTIEKSVKTKKVNDNLNLKVSMPNTDRPIVSSPETQNHLWKSKRTSHNKINSGNSYPQVQQHRLKNPKMWY